MEVVKKTYLIVVTTICLGLYCKKAFFAVSEVLSEAPLEEVVESEVEDLQLADVGEPVIDEEVAPESDQVALAVSNERELHLEDLPQILDDLYNDRVGINVVEKLQGNSPSDTAGKALLTQFVAVLNNIKAGNKRQYRDDLKELFDGVQEGGSYDEIKHALEPAIFTQIQNFIKKIALKHGVEIPQTMAFDPEKLSAIYKETLEANKKDIEFMVGSFVAKAGSSFESRELVSQYKQALMIFGRFKEFITLYTMLDEVKTVVGEMFDDSFKIAFASDILGQIVQMADSFADMIGVTTERTKQFVSGRFGKLKARIKKKMKKGDIQVYEEVKNIPAISQMLQLSLTEYVGFFKGVDELADSVAQIRHSIKKIMEKANECAGYYNQLITQ